MRLRRELGKYEIVRELGRGGMAVVYLARQTDLDRFVVLKELAALHAADRSFAERFLRESRVGGSLQHPNIVTVYEYFEAEGMPYIAMELLARGSLRPWVGSLTLPQVFGVLSDVLAGLEHAVGHGVIHRDIKPENLLVTEDGTVKIADFGIATAMTRAGGLLTATGTTLGTPGYMAPEQAMAQDLGPATDLYALGCVAFELTTGRLPFEADEPLPLMLKHVSEPPPPARSLKPELDETVSAWIASLLAKDPAARPAGPAEAFNTLEDIAIGLLGPRWRRDAPIRDAPPQATPRTDLETPPARYVTEAPRSYAPPPAAPAPPAPAPAADADDDDFVSYELPAAAPPVPTQGPASVPPPARHDTVVGNGHAAAAPPLPSVAVPVPGPYTPPPAEYTGTFFGGPALPPEGFEAGLATDFQYLHGPLIVDEGGVSLLGNQGIVDQLKERLLHSRGGSFLLTGFRGVGKTTVVLRALDELQGSAGGGVEYLPVVLNVARPTTVDELLFEVVRRLFEALTDRGVLAVLEPAVREALLLAYARTSLAFKETSSRSRESSQTLNLDLAKLVPLTPKLGVSRRRTDSLAREASFLAYSHADVEHDFLRILSLLDIAGAAAPVPPRRFRRRRAPWRGRLVVVLDELDKLTATPDGLATVDTLLMGLKNLLTARNVHFVFVGGPEMHDAFMRDVARGNSVYESVFACHMYVPCVWSASRRLVTGIVEPGSAGPPLDELIDYFDFKSRGIPRLLLRELNSFVCWTDAGARVCVSDLDAIRVRFYARIQAAVNDFVASALDNEMLSMPIDEDRWRLGAYYITDWILRRGAAEFTIADILADEATPSPLMHASADRVERLVRHLIGHRIVEKVWYQDVNHTMLGDAGQVNSYRLRSSVVDDLAAFARRNERERAELGAAPDPVDDGTPWATAGRVARLKQGRYELGDLIGIGGVGRVYRGIDRIAGREVAVKILAPHLVSEPSARGRWRRETEIAKQLQHEHIVRTFEVIDDGRVAAIVMELVDGPTLREVLPLHTPSAVIVACQLLSALEVAAEAGLARFDIKPENIVFRDGAGAVIVDLGLVKRTEQGAGAFNTFVVGTASPARIGTPAYMSPEQAMGAPVDIRSDIYCMGVLLYETIVGRHLRDLTGSAADILMQITRETPVLSELDVSEELRDALSCSLARAPEERFQTPAEMRAALLRTSEGEAGATIPAAELLLQRRPAGGRLGVFRAPRPTDVEAVSP